MSDTKESGKDVAAYAGGVVQVKDDTDGLNKRIQKHYDVTSDQFLKVWGEHIHHGYYKSPTDTDEQAQVNQVIQLAETSGVSAGSRVLDVGCGIGGTARYLARERGCKVTAITNSKRQVEIARKLTADEVAGLSSKSPPSLAAEPGNSSTDGDFVQYPGGDGAGAVRVLHLDVAQMREHLGGKGETFDCVWISEVVFHLQNRQLFMDSAFALLAPGGCLVIADIFRTAPDPASAPKRVQHELASIRRNHLCPELGTVDEYNQMASRVGFRPRREPMDITKNVAKTWDAPVPIRSLLFIIFRGRDTIGYWRGMRSMKTAYAHGTAAYAILCFEKP
ncbi:gamma-tocopherol methyltransferase-like protein [Triangularia verruculosa]|uniref:Gamma-tocopherol methyltransferase-like protein n=1 Tax=Triangularia verruculosa TaxID=2587418 RepID=A0AAN6XM55_9PEZI|nr:gamma-tocopherol methyltransferase-like protein [Triangularia verruculosa]